MPAITLKQEIELKTRNDYTKVDAEFTFRVSGRELPTMALLGELLESAIATIQTKVTESYKVIPERIGVS